MNVEVLAVAVVCVAGALMGLRMVLQHMAGERLAEKTEVAASVEKELRDAIKATETRLSKLEMARLTR